ncbi:MAG: EF-P 5-aminopentanol modification-associated protein YfmF [Symbiobacteriia bacterium]
MAGDFTERKLTNGVTLHVWATPKFKTTTLQVFIQQALRPETATQTALLPMVLRRGTRQLPQTIDLWRRLDRLYGAELGGDVLKRGERQIINLGINLANEKFLGTDENLLGEGLEMLAAMTLDPAVEGEAFRPDYVEQEKDNLHRQIESLFNDKIYYSMARCYEEMCQGEPFAVYKYGRAEDIPGITAAGLYAYYRRLLLENPIDIFAAGDVNVDEMAALVERHFSFNRRTPRPLPATEVKSEPGATVRHVVEPQDVTQGKLCLGYRTGVTRRDADWYPLVVANGVLGGYAHSKLFTHVREKASLCYYAYSSLESTKGLAMIYSGIETDKYDQALALIQEQVAATQRGEISDYEFDATKKALVRDLEASEDSPDQKISAAIDMLINGAEATTESRIRQVQAVTREQAAAAAKHIKLDTIYFLRDQAVEPSRAPAAAANLS